jgi:hypothetical protein
VPEGREDWRNFVDSADIQPLGRAYGYQLEIPFSEPGYTAIRQQSFFDDPRNLRGLLGNISFDEAGNRLDDAQVFQNALRVKRDIRGNPKLMQDLSDLTSSNIRLGNLATMSSGLEDAYSLRQLFGETPSAYGSRSHLENISGLDRRGLKDPPTGNYYRVSEGGGDLTNELSPFERTAQTSVNLRPAVLANDLQQLQRPDVVSQFVNETGVDKATYAPLKANAVLARSLRPDYLSSPIDIDIPNNTDNEYLRTLVNRNDLGLVQIGRGSDAAFPGEFVENLQSLQNRPGFSSDYVYRYLRNHGTLPDEAYDPDLDFDDDSKGGAADYEGRSSGEVYKFAGDYPEVSRVLEGFARGGRISKEDLNKNYSNYIPESYKKLPFGAVDTVASELLAIAQDNPDVRDRVRTFMSNVFEEGPDSALSRLANTPMTIQNQRVKKRAEEFVRNYVKDVEGKRIEVPTRTAGVGGGEYLKYGGSYDAAKDKLDFFQQPYIPDDFEPVISETFYSNEGKPYEVAINRDPNATYLSPEGMNESVLRMFEDKPYAGTYNIDFTVNGSYIDADAPPEVKQDIMKFVANNFRRGLPLGAVVRNSPLGNESSRSKVDRGNKRSLWYQTFGFGADTIQGQYGYIDPDTGNTVPIQPYKAPRIEGEGTYKRSYYSVDPVVAAGQGLRDLGSAVRRTPAALAPGVADLIPSPEAIRTGFRQGPAAMGRQMGQEFVQSLPASAATAAVLATPALAPLAPGIGAAMVGTAGARAANEVVRQTTGEGVIPKLRQAIGTAPRTGVASPQRRGPVVTPQVRPLNAQQRQEMQRRQNRNELQRRADLARERFNPRRLEFGLSELLFGR